MDNSNKKKEKNYIKKNINVKKIKLDKDKNTPELPKFKSLTAKNVSLKDKKLLRPTTSRFSANINKI